MSCFLAKLALELFRLLENRKQYRKDKEVKPNSPASRICLAPVITAESLIGGLVLKCTLLLLCFGSICERFI